MWNRPVFCLWMTARIQHGKRQIGFVYALPLFTLLMIADILEDITVPVDFILSRSHPDAGGLQKRLPAGSLKGLSAVLKTVILQLITKTGPTEIADIQAGGARVRCGLK